jgi:glycosyltransferase involved in cell wall biosynthesis
MFCSTIIPTVNRPSLAKAVCSVLEQVKDQEDWEVIVINDSWEPLPDQDWQRSPQVRLINTQHRERSVARNTGAAIAKGKYLHFLDDDDWMLPGAIEILRRLANSSRAAWIYGGYQLVDNEGELLDVFRPDERGNCFIRFIASEWLPLQASLIDARAFFNIGGFAHLEALSGGDEDVDLSRQLSLYNDLDCTPEIVAAIRTGIEGSSTNYASLQEQSRQSREKALDMSPAFRRMQNSARTRPRRVQYWQGRVLYAYLSSLQWNLSHGRLFKALSRALHGLGVLALAGRALLYLSFWIGATKPHITTGWLSSDG